MNRQIAKKKTIEVLDFFLGIPEAFIDGFDRKEFYKLMNGMPTEKALTVTNICKIFDRFKKAGYIETSPLGKNESVRFTNKAKLTIVDRLAEKESVDGKYRLISFDVPEKLRLSRDKFRRTIKHMGFRQIQQSLWVSDRNIGHLVDMAADEYKISPYVVYIVSSKTNIDDLIPGILNTKKHNPDRQGGM